MKGGHEAFKNEPKHEIELWERMPPRVRWKFVDHDPAGHAEPPVYPVNLMRQEVLDMVPQDAFALPIDVDFIPSTNSHEALLALNDTIYADRKTTVFVIPTFEANENTVPPATFDELMACRDRKECAGVLEHKYEWAHRRTNLSHWYNTNANKELYEVEWEWTYEPYICKCHRSHNSRHCQAFIPSAPLVSLCLLPTDSVCAFVCDAMQWGIIRACLPTTKIFSTMAMIRFNGFTISPRGAASSS